MKFTQFLILLTTISYVVAIPSSKVANNSKAPEPFPQTTTTSIPVTSIKPDITTTTHTTTLDPKTTTSKPTTPNPTNTTVTSSTTSTTTTSTTNTTSTTTVIPTTSSSTNTSSTVDPGPNTTSLPVPSPPSPSPKGRHFDGLSFMGGIILTACLVGISVVSYKFYKIKTERSYRTL